MKLRDSNDFKKLKTWLQIIILTVSVFETPD
jgi:hypothetical protein